LGGLGKSSVFTYQATQPSFIFGYRYRHHRLIQLSVISYQ